MREVGPAAVIALAPDGVFCFIMRHALALLLLAAALNMRTAGAGNLVIIVNPASGIENLTRSQIVDIFLGRNRKLPSGAVAIPIDLRSGDPERKEFYLLLVGKDLAQMSSYWARLVFSGQATPPFPVPEPPVPPQPWGHKRRAISIVRA